MSTRPSPGWGLDVYDIASRHGLKPTRQGKRIRFLCPWCTDSGVSPHKGLSASAAADLDGQPWLCHRCDQRGVALTLAAYFGDIELREAPPRPAPKHKPKPKKEDKIAKAWSEIMAATSEGSIARIQTWAQDVRRWPSDVAQAVAQLDDVAAPADDEGGGRSGQAIVRSAASKNRRLLIAIRDHKGIVRTAARRWIEAGPPQGGPEKSMALPGALVGDSDEWGGVMAYGSIPEAVRAAELGEPVYLVEGGPNYLAAVGALQIAGDPGAAVGFYNTTTAPKLVRALVHELAERNLIAPRVVLVPDIDVPKPDRDGKLPEHGAGMRAALACGELLRGRAGVFLAEVPTGSEPSGDLSDLLARDGLGKTLGLLRTPRCLFPPPVQIQHAHAEMKALFTRAVIEATQKNLGGPFALVIFRVDPGAGKSRQALETAAQVASGRFPIPVNGRRPRSWPQTLPWPPAERSVIFATPDHDLAAAKGAELTELDATARWRQLHGLLHYCQFRESVDDVFPGVGRRGICGDPKDADQRCHLAETCTGAQDPVAYRGDVTFAAHQLLGKINADLVIVDESPGVVKIEAENDDAIRTLYTCRLLPRVRKWRQGSNPEAGDAARILNELVYPLAQRHAAAVSAGELDPYPKRITGDDLKDLIAGRPDLVDALLVGCIEKWRAMPPAPLPVEARSGFHLGRHMPSRTAFNAMRALARYFSKLAGITPTEEDPLKIINDDGSTQGGQPPDPMVAVRLDVNGRWSLEVRQVMPLPPAPVIVLDATGDLTLLEWQAAYPDRKVVIRHLDVQGAAPASAIHLDSRALTRRGMLDPSGRPRPESVEKVRRVIGILADRTRGRYPRFDGGSPTRLAVLTHKPLADALAGVPAATKDSVGAGLRGIVSELTQRHFEVAAGYFGKHDRGTNTFQGVDGFAVIGDPFGNFGDVEADALLLKLEPEAVAAARTAATCRQAIARARHIRRKPQDRVVLIFAGRTPPDLPGVTWTTEDIPDGRPVARTTNDLVGLLLRIAADECVVGPKPLELYRRKGTPWEQFDLDGVPRTTRDRAVRGVARLKRWGMHHLNGAGGKVYVFSRTVEDAEIWAEKHGLKV